MFSNLVRMICAAGGVVIAFSSIANATLITGVDVTASSERYGFYGQDRRAIYLVDGSGLNVNGPGTHTTTPDLYQWLGENENTGGLPVAQQWLKFDLKFSHTEVELSVWNSNEAGYTNRGIKTLNIMVNSTDDANLSNWTDLGTFQFTQAPGIATVDFSQTLPLSTSSSFQYVYFDVTTNWGDSSGPNGFVGLSEVQFNTATAPSVPEPNSLALIVLGYMCISKSRKQRNQCVE